MKLFKIIYKDDENVYQEYKVSESKRALTKELSDNYSIKSEDVLLVQDITKDIYIDKQKFVYSIEQCLKSDFSENAVKLLVAILEKEL